MQLSGRKLFESLLLGQDGLATDDLLTDSELRDLRSIDRRLRRSRSRRRSKGRVYILPGIMGSTLYGDRRFFLDDWIWISPLDLANGAVEKLKIGAEPNPVYARDAVDLFYLKMKLMLRAENYDVDYLPYDWRHSPNDTGAELLKRIKQNGEKNVILVCHSMGGLVARQMSALDPSRKTIKQVVTLGTPNYGSYSPVEVFALTHSTLQFLAKLDQKHTDKEIVDKVIKYFRGLLEMLPDKKLRPNEDYFKLSEWPGPLKPASAALREAKAAKSILPPVDERFIQIVGMSRDTIQSASVSRGKFKFKVSNDGDGTVPRDLAEMGDIDRYYMDGTHGKLPAMRLAIKAIIDLLETGKTTRLRKTPFKRGQGPSDVQQIGTTEMRKQHDLVPSSEIDRMLDRIFDEQFIS
ncbi:MAG: hypothetical protein QNJ29_11175 [Rhizobiaceae bacterium]|nr:hypothetical protein [Rhizobiaceae bacterium]